MVYKLYNFYESKDKTRYMDMINMYYFHCPNHYKLISSALLQPSQVTEPVAVVVAELTEEQQSF